MYALNQNTKLLCPIKGKSQNMACTYKTKKFIDFESMSEHIRL